MVRHRVVVVPEWAIILDLRVEVVVLLIVLVLVR